MRCTANAKRTGEQCEKHAVAGASVCRSHGAGAPQVRARAAERLAEADARRTWARIDHEPVKDPLRELQLLAGELVAFKEVLREGMAEIGSWGYAGMSGEQVRAVVTLYAGTVKELGGLLTAIGRLDIDQRLARIDEQIAEKVLAGLTRALEDQGITGPDAADIIDATSRHLQLIESGDAA